MKPVFLSFFLCWLLISSEGLCAPKSAVAPNAAKQIWLVVPGLWDQPSTEQEKYLKFLEEHISKALQTTAKVTVKTAPGFMLSQYLHLQKEIDVEKPSWIFYVQRSVFYAYDLKEFWLSKNQPFKPIVSEKFSSEEMDESIPAWMKVLKKDWGATLQESFFLKKRLQDEFSRQEYFTTLDPFILHSAKYISEALSRSMEEKTQFVFLISPERIKYADLIFPDNNLQSFFARTYFFDSVTERAPLKKSLGANSFQRVLLPKEFAELAQAQNLVAGSQYVLNSTGILQSFQILTPVISDFLRRKSGP